VQALGVEFLLAECGDADGNVLQAFLAPGCGHYDLFESGATGSITLGGCGYRHGAK
jgi:hypothetical protein